jgi:SAM-dependent methyltransferase
MTGAGSASLIEDLRQLGPWHLDVEVRDGLTTASARDSGTDSGPLESGPIEFRSPGERFRRLMLEIYPHGLEGRSVLDCACNCGAYLFWARDLGARGGYGFDVRAHWIRQAQFLMENRDRPATGLGFEVLDLYDLPQRGLSNFDITLFNGIFYHLPDPVRGLRIAADLTRELLIVTTATKEGDEDGKLVVQQESTDFLMSGVYGLNWRPTGPTVMAKILAWAGFPEVRVHNHVTDVPGHGDAGRIQLIAARTANVLAHYDSRA